MQASPGAFSSEYFLTTSWAFVQSPDPVEMFCVQIRVARFTLQIYAAYGHGHDKENNNALPEPGPNQNEAREPDIGGRLPIMERNPQSDETGKSPQPLHFRLTQPRK
jgi:hypothetical protein